MRMTIAIAALVFATITPAHAGIGLDCNLDTTQADGFIGDRFVAGIDEPTGEAAVHDALVDQFNNGQTLDGRVEHADETSVLIGWELMVRDADGIDAEMVYRARYDRAQKYLRVTARPKGYNTEFRAEGGCKVEGF
ncbi:MAG: hypothetical protein AAF764_04170 [Pseudomonadota bacterium]